MIIYKGFFDHDPELHFNPNWEDYCNHVYDRNNNQVGVVSGSFDPIHLGHIDYIIEASKKCDILFVVVNGNEFLKRRRGYAFQDEKDRAKIVDNIKGVNFTFVWDDGSQDVSGALKLIRPNYFFQGGPIAEKDIPNEELEVCENYNIELVYGVGGIIKQRRSNELLENFKKLQTSA